MIWWMLNKFTVNEYGDIDKNNERKRILKEKTRIWACFWEGKLLEKEEKDLAAENDDVNKNITTMNKIWCWLSTEREC